MSIMDLLFGTWNLEFGIWNLKNTSVSLVVSLKEINSNN
jgi:hypothetical protein